MRKIINATFASLDGVIENPQDWPSGDPDPRAVTIQTELLFACDAVLLGRRTYESFAAVWPAMPGDAYSDRINSMTKYVVSSTLDDPQWANTTVIDDDPVSALERIKDQPGGDIVQYGFGRLAHLLVAHGLLDEVQLWVHPLFAGGNGSSALLHRGGPATPLDLVDTVVLKDGVVVLTYELQPRRDGPTETG
jgi:dihydrofolate reductase